MSYFVLAESTFIERDLFKENYRMVQVEHNSLSLKKSSFFSTTFFNSFVCDLLHYCPCSLKTISINPVLKSF